MNARFSRLRAALLPPFDPRAVLGALLPPLGPTAVLAALLLTLPSTVLAANADSLSADIDSASVSPAAPGTTTPADSAAARPLDSYLQNLSGRRDDDFALEALSISDAEVDSLIRVFEAGGGEPLVRDGDVGPAPTSWRFDVELGAARFNRVEGLNVMPALTIRPPTARRIWGHARAGWGWAAGEPTWRGEIGIPLTRNLRAPTLILAHERDVFAYGAGGLPGNSVLALTVADDLNDYYRGQGWSAQLGWTPGRLGVSIEVAEEKQESLPNETDFALFEDGTQYRVNPRIDDVTLRLTQTRIRLGDESLDRLAGVMAWTHAGQGLGGDRDFDSVRADVVGRRRLWFGDEAKLRLTAGTATGDVPFQALHFVGGTRLLRGYEINEFPTRQFLAAAFDYKIGTDLLHWIPFLRHARVQFVPFADAAARFETQDADGVVSKLDTPDWRFSTGLGIQHNILGIPGGQGQLRLDAVKRLDRGDERITWRLGLTWER
ncbi:MAG: BamA/TamA family outer membrane protein [bacterium]